MSSLRTKICHFDLKQLKYICDICLTGSKAMLYSPFSYIVNHNVFVLFLTGPDETTCWSLLCCWHLWVINCFVLSEISVALSGYFVSLVTLHSFWHVCLVVKTINNFFFSLSCPSDSLSASSHLLQGWVAICYCRIISLSKCIAISESHYTNIQK